MEITSKAELFEVIKGLQAENSEIKERLDNLTPTKEDPKEEEKSKDDPIPEKTEEELDEIEKLLSE